MLLLIGKYITILTTVPIDILLVKPLFVFRVASGARYIVAFILEYVRLVGKVMTNLILHKYYKMYDNYDSGFRGDM